MKDHPRRFLQAVESGMAGQPAADGHCAEKPKAIISGQSQAEGMAKFACSVTYQDLTPDRRERLKVSILDSLACAIVAIGAPGPRQVVSAVESKKCTGVQHLSTSA
jgi:hypothetical protein